MTAPAEHQPKKPAKQEQEPASKEVTEVAPGVLRVQLPMAFTGLGHVNTYVLEDSRGAAIVDPGLPGRITFKALQNRLESTGIPLRRIHTVLITHSHPDHFGSAGVVAERTGAKIVTSSEFRLWWDPDQEDIDEDPATEEKSPAQTPFGRPTPWGGKTYLPPIGRRIAWRAARLVGRRWFRTPEVSHRLADGDTISLADREWTAMITPGHTEDHLCLFDPEEGVLLAGDHVLPTITPHLSGLIPGDPLSDYTSSLERMEALDGVTVALPAHGHPFEDLAGRAAAIRVHHDERLVQLHGVLVEQEPAGVTEMSLALFGPKHGHDSLAESETYAHLEHLCIQGRAQRRTVDGIYQYRSAD